MSTDRAAKNLLEETGFRERRANRQTDLSQEQDGRNLRAAWQLFDYMVWVTAKAGIEETGSFFAQPHQFRLNWKETAILLTDQVPVWLKVEAGTQLVSEETLAALRTGAKTRRQRRTQVK